jgi:hypothetical protein
MPKVCYNKFMQPLNMDEEQSGVHRIKSALNFKLLVAVLVVSMIAGAGTGYLMSSGSTGGSVIPLIEKTPDNAAQDTRTFRDFAEGKITKKPATKGVDSSEGTHLLVRDGATPVALTSSVVDLSTYEDKKVKVFGETNKATGAGWFMDVGRVEVVQ